MRARSLFGCGTAALGFQDDLAGQRSGTVERIIFLQTMRCCRLGQPQRLAYLRLQLASAKPAADIDGASTQFFRRGLEHHKAMQ